jgi:Tol biopolymer transport system component
MLAHLKQYWGKAWFLLIPGIVVVVCSCDESDEIGVPVPDQLAVDAWPAWSPDGREIAYYRFVESSSGPPGIYSIQSDGSDNHLLFDSSIPTWDLRFSPDGKQLSMTIDLEVYVFDLDQQSLKQITESGGNAQAADWSPDGRSLVYSGPFIRSGQAPDGGLHIVDIATLNDRKLLNNGQMIYGSNPRWSPSGEPIAFWASDHLANRNIFTVTSNAAELDQLTNSRGETADNPVWINGGKLILYNWRSYDGHTPLQTRVMQADGSQQRTWPVLIRRYEAISPDSRHFVTYGAQDDITLVLFIRGIEDKTGETLRQLTSYSPPPLPDLRATR